jgi:WD40 repeat protein
MRILKGHKEPVQRVAYAKDGTALVSVSAQREARLWDLATGEPRWSLDADWVFWACFTPDSKGLLTGQSRNLVRLWDVATGSEQPAPLRPYRDSHKFHHFAFSPEGSRCAAADTMVGTNVIHWWDLPSWKPRGTTDTGIDSYVSPCDLEFSPDGRTLAVLIFEGLLLLDARTRKPRATIPFDIKQDMGRLAFHPQGQQLAVSSGMRTAVLDLGTGKEVAEVRLPKKYMLQAAYTPDGRYLATVSNEETVKVWDTSSWRLVREFAWQVGGLRCLAFSPDGMTAAAGGTGKKVVVWDVDL